MSLIFLVVFNVFVLFWCARFKLFSCNYGCIDINQWLVSSCKFVNNMANSNEGRQVLCDGLLHEEELNMYTYFFNHFIVHHIYTSFIFIVALVDPWWWFVLTFCKHFKWRFKKFANGIKARTLHNLIIELILTLKYCSLANGTKFRMLQLARILANWLNVITSLQPYLRHLLQVLEFPN